MPIGVTVVCLCANMNLSCSAKSAVGFHRLSRFGNDFPELTQSYQYRVTVKVTMYMETRQHW